jgi:ribonuclease E
MDSAERRTDEDAEPSNSVEPGSWDDNDLFFPRSQPEQPGEGGSAVEEPQSPSESWDEPATVGESIDDGDELDRAQASPREAAMEEEPDLDAEGPEFRQRPQRSRGDRSRGRRGGRDRRSSGRPGMGRPGMGRPKPLIQDIFRRGQEVLVQVIKEGLGTKGPTLSTYISIAGRYLVLMPGLNRIGVSRKIADDEQRRRLREILNELQPPKGLGFIIRTAGLDKNKKELQRDLAYLSRLWQVVVRRIRKLKAPAEIYQESDMITRTIRDTFTSEIDAIWVDEPSAFDHAQEFLQIVMPRYASRIRLYADAEPLFHRYGIEDEIGRIQQRHVPLPNGGSIVIDQTEALVAIDVNSGNFRADNSAEETAYQMNLLAAKEIARQLRLRDLGGVIVNDFIDMRDEKHRRGVERALRDAIKRDRARTKILRISAFGLIEMTRQRIRPSLKRSVYQDCPHCGGTGQVKTCESMSIDVMRMLQLAAHHQGVHRVQIKVAEDAAHYLLNRKRREISKLEELGGIQVTISGVLAAAPESLDFVCYDNNNNEVKFLPQEEPKTRRR